ncbi:MAG: DUF503 domain-containing protein [Acidimicrobiales bacterium]
MHVQALHMDLHLPSCRSLKAKRAVLRPIIEGIDHRFPVAVAEVDHQDLWQRAAVGVAAVSGTHRQVEEILDEVERFVWSRPDIEVGRAERTWMEVDS